MNKGTACQCNVGFIHVQNLHNHIKRHSQCNLSRTLPARQQLPTTCATPKLRSADPRPGLVRLQPICHSSPDVMVLGMDSPRGQSRLACYQINSVDSLVSCHDLRKPFNYNGPRSCSPVTVPQLQTVPKSSMLSISTNTLPNADSGTKSISLLAATLSSTCQGFSRSRHKRLGPAVVSRSRSCQKGILTKCFRSPWIMAES